MNPPSTGLGPVGSLPAHARRIHQRRLPCLLPRNLAFATFFIALAWLLIPSIAHAGDETQGTAEINISLDLEIHEQDPIEFGTITRPSSGTGDNQVTLDWESGDVTVTGDGNGFHVDGGQRGRYRVRGPRDEEVEITATIGDFGVPGITVEETHLEGEQDSVTVELNPSGMFFAELGGVLTINSDVPEGVHTAEVYVTANFP